MKLRHGTSLWVVAAVKAKFCWPTSRMHIPFQGREFLLRPETDEHASSVCIKDENGLILREGSNGTFIGEFQSEKKLAAPTAIKDGEIFRVGLTRLRLGGVKNDRFMVAGSSAAVRK